MNESLHLCITVLRSPALASVLWLWDWDGFSGCDYWKACFICTCIHFAARPAFDIMIFFLGQGSKRRRLSINFRCTIVFLWGSFHDYKLDPSSKLQVWCLMHYIMWIVNSDYDQNDTFRCGSWRPPCVNDHSFWWRITSTALFLCC